MSSWQAVWVGWQVGGFSVFSTRIWSTSFIMLWWDTCATSFYLICLLSWHAVRLPLFINSQSSVVRDRLLNCLVPYPVIIVGENLDGWIIRLNSLKDDQCAESFYWKPIRVDFRHRLRAVPKLRFMYISNSLATAVTRCVGILIELYYHSVTRCVGILTELLCIINVVVVYKFALLYTGHSNSVVCANCILNFQPAWQKTYYGCH